MIRLMHQNLWIKACVIFILYCQLLFDKHLKLLFNKCINVLFFSYIFSAYSISVKTSMNRYLSNVISYRSYKSVDVLAFKKHFVK